MQQFQVPMVKNATDMENHVFSKAKSKVKIYFHLI